MARISGRDADMVFNAVVIDDELNSITLNFQVPEIEVTAFADVGQNFLAGKLGVTLELAGTLDPAAAQGDATLFAALGGPALTWDFEPDGTTGYNGYAIVTGYSITAGVNGPVTYAATLRHNGISAAADGGIPVRG